MKFKTLGNREIRLEILPSRFPLKSREKSKSSGQYNLGRVLQGLYGKEAILLEDFVIPETRLSLDFFMPHYNLAFEFQGEQHYKFNKFFHPEKSALNQQKERDVKKRQWCQLNNILLIEVFNDSITISELKELIYV